MKTSINTRDMSPGAQAAREEIERLHILNADKDLTADQLSQKYNAELGDGRHPLFGEEAWMQEVLNRETLRGYWDWVTGQIEQDLDNWRTEAAIRTAAIPLPEEPHG